VSFVPAYQNSSMTPQPKASPPWLPAYTIIIGKAPAKTVTDPMCIEQTHERHVTLLICYNTAFPVELYA